ncbi:MAG: ATP-binding protein, partial [Clostridia bacterium]|nr:ATP-binding protein [Clostridia bacterium]
MDELSLYVLDITMNSVRAGATEISIDLCEEGEWLTFTVTDNGCGMTEEQVKRLTDPFFTTRKTRKVGLGIPFLTMLAEMTGGSVTVKSIHESVSENHGTTTSAKFGRNHIDFVPLGDIIETVKTLIQGSPEVN